MASGSVRSSVLRRRPHIPIISCPTCGRTVQLKNSWTEKHIGWVFYRFSKHAYGCNFWHWEQEYVDYLVDNGYLRGDEAIDAAGWAEERREEIMLRKEEKAVTGGASFEEMVLKNSSALLDAVKEVVLLLKIVAGLLTLLCVVAIVKK